MKRTTMMLTMATAIYALAWFLPVVKGGTTLAEGGVPGWEALRMALLPVFPIQGLQGDHGFIDMIGALSGLTNLWFVASFVVLAFLPRRPRPVLVWGLVGATLINTVWFWRGPGDLRAGYYLWFLSFVALAAAARQAPAEPTRAGAFATVG